MESRN